MVQFDRPVGAKADAKELEYISALHQTGLTLRADGSIKDEDIKAYLRSRFGIEVTVEEVRWNILQGFGGSDGDGEVIDLMELTAIILIPLLLKAAALQQGQVLPPDVLPPPDFLLETVLQIIHHDVSGRRDGYPELSPAFVKKMLTVYGETAMAQDEGLIHEMIHAANGASEMEGVFDVKSFAEALTKDVRLYDIANETCPTTSLQDVFSYGQVSSKAMGTNDPSAGLEPVSVREIDTLDHRFTAPAIDFQADTYRSKALVVSLWGCVIFGLFTSSIRLWTILEEAECDPIGPEETRNENLSAVWCRIRNSISAWLVLFLYFCAVGIVSIGMGSLGNYVGPTRWFMPLIGALYILGFSFSASMIPISDESAMEYDESAMEYDDSHFQYMVIMSQVLGCLTACFHLRNFASIVFPGTDFERSVWAQRLGLAPMVREVHAKTAGAHKVNQLVRNAMKLMKNESSSSVFKTYFGHGLSAFELNGESRKTTGGFFWCWASFRDGSMFEKEGIWYSTRLLASNLSQLAISIFILLLGIRLIREFNDNFRAAPLGEQASRLIFDALNSAMNKTNMTNATTTELTNVFGSSLSKMMGESSVAVQCQDMMSSNGSPLIENLCSQDSLGYYDCSGVQNSEQALCILIENPYLFEQDNATVYQLMETSGFNQDSMQVAVKAQFDNLVHQIVHEMYPTEEYMITVPLGIGMIVALLAALRLTFLYLPGVTTTILQLRSGVIPSLKSPHFEKYREAPDTVALLTGSLFWGCLVSSLLMGSLVGFLVFLFLWQGSQGYMVEMCVILAGIVSIMTIKGVAGFCCRQRFYKGLYRTRPAASNVLLLALEWANFVFTSAFILVRMVKIVFIAMAESGRIDRPFLAEGVGQLGPLEFDPYPTIHIRDLVAHEAHRHPYIEILGTIYLMKLRYSKHFGSRAGSAWRLMFIYALFPWMHQYRLSERQPTIAPTGDDEEEGNDEVSVIPERLPSLRGSALQIDASLLEAENKMLKEQINQILSKQRFGYY